MAFQSEKDVLFEHQVLQEWSLIRELNAGEEDGSFIAKAARRILKVPLEVSCWNPAIFPAFIQHVYEHHPDWQFALSPNERLLAVLKHDSIEFLSAEKGFKAKVGFCALRADKWPKWRKLAWSHDSSHLAVSMSDGTVVVLEAPPSHHHHHAGGSASSLGVHTCHLLHTLINDRSGDLNKIPGFIQPVASLLLRSPRHETFNGHHYQFELLLLGFDGFLRSFLLNKRGPGTIQTTLMIDSETNGVDGSIVRHHKFFLGADLSSTLSMSIHEQDSLLVVAGCHCDLTPGGAPGLNNLKFSFTLWKLIEERPYYRRLQEKVAPTGAQEPVPQAEPSTVSNPSLFQTLRRMIQLSRESNKTMFHCVAFSPNGRFLAAAGLNGILQIVESASGKVIEEFSLDKLQEEKEQAEKEDAKDAAKNQGPLGLTELSWWSEHSLTLFTNGGMFVFNLMDQRKILEFLEKPGANLALIAQKQNRTSLLEHTSVVRKVKWTKNKHLTFTYSLQKDDSSSDSGKAGDGEAQEATALQRMFDYITAPINFVTEYFLFNWEENPDWIPHRKFVPAVQKKYRIIDIQKIHPFDLLQIRIKQGRFEEAINLASQYDLPTDSIYQTQWESAAVSEDSITNFLDKITSNSIVFKSCSQRIPSTPRALRLLLNYGLNKTDFLAKSGRHHKDPSSMILTEQELECCVYRRFFLDSLDLLDTFEEFGQVPAMFSQDFGTFRSNHILDFALAFASSSLCGELEVVFSRHGKELLPFRLALLENIPETTSPTIFASFLPQIEKGGRLETPRPEKPWRTPDWSEREPILSKTNLSPLLQKKISDGARALKRSDYPATREELTQWYSSRALAIDKLSGQTTMALGLLQLGIEKGFDLASLRDELSTFQTLIYEILPHSDLGSNMNFVDFSNLSTKEVVSLVMSKSTDASFVTDIREFLLPFLDNRVGTTSGENPVQKSHAIFHEFVIELAQDNIQRCCLVFENSNHSLPKKQRFIDNDIVLMSLALQCAYRCPRTDQWSVLNRIFCSLPSKNATSPDQGSPQWQALQAKIDLLDLHLNAAELLDKYKIPQPLSFFEKVSDNEQLQRMTMAKLSRRTSEFTQHEDWLALLADMTSLRARLFTKVPSDSVQELYLSSLLSSGEFELAQELLHPKRKKTPITLPLATLEKLVIEVSKEYFNNAESGKANNPELENALKCLALVIPATPESKKETALVRAVHELSRHGVCLKSGIPILPMEVRLHPNRGELVLKMLEANPALYKDIQGSLKLLTQLDSHTPENEMAVTTMAARAAIMHRDHEHAFRICEISSAQKGANTLGLWSIYRDLALATDWRDVSLRKKAAILSLQGCPDHQVSEVLRLFNELDLCTGVTELTSLGDESEAEKMTAPEELDAVLGLRTEPASRPSAGFKVGLGEQFSTPAFFSNPASGLDSVGQEPARLSLKDLSLRYFALKNNQGLSPETDDLLVSLAREAVRFDANLAMTYLYSVVDIQRIQDFFAEMEETPLTQKFAFTVFASKVLLLEGLSNPDDHLSVSKKIGALSIAEISERVAQLQATKGTEVSPELAHLLEITERYQASFEKEFRAASLAKLIEVLQGKFRNNAQPASVGSLAPEIAKYSSEVLTYIDESVLPSLKAAEASFAKLSLAYTICSLCEISPAFSSNMASRIQVLTTLMEHPKLATLDFASLLTYRFQPTLSFYDLVRPALSEETLDVLVALLSQVQELAPISQFQEEKGFLSTHPSPIQHPISSSDLRIRFLESNFVPWMKTRSLPQQNRHLSFCESQLPKLDLEHLVRFAWHVVENQSSSNLSIRGRVQLLTAVRGLLEQADPVTPHSSSHLAQAAADNFSLPPQQQHPSNSSKLGVICSHLEILQALQGKASDSAVKALDMDYGDLNTFLWNVREVALLGESTDGLDAILTGFDPLFPGVRDKFIESVHNLCSGDTFDKDTKTKLLEILHVHFHLDEEKKTDVEKMKVETRIQNLWSVQVPDTFVSTEAKIEFWNRLMKLGSEGMGRKNALLSLLKEWLAEADPSLLAQSWLDLLLSYSEEESTLTKVPDLFLSLPPDTLTEKGIDLIASSLELKSVGTYLRFALLQPPDGPVRKRALEVLFLSLSDPSSAAFQSIKGDRLAHVFIALSGALPSLTSSPLYPVVVQSILGLGPQEKLRSIVVSLAASDLILANFILPAASIVFRHTNLHPGARVPSIAVPVLRTFLRSVGNQQHESTGGTEEEVLPSILHLLVPAPSEKLASALERLSGNAHEHQ